VPAYGGARCFAGAKVGEERNIVERLEHVTERISRSAISALMMFLCSISVRQS
jgi:hypothetical protein